MYFTISIYRIDPVISEANTAGRSGLEQQQWLNQREQQPRSILNTRRGKNLRYVELYN